MVLSLFPPEGVQRERSRVPPARSQRERGAEKEEERARGERGRGEGRKKKAPGSNPAPHYPIIYYASN